MELFSEEATKLRGLLDDWAAHPEEIEVEATFGYKGEVDMQTFLRVISRLKSKGHQPISQQDRLTIKTPEDVRFTLVNSGQVAQYCRDNQIVGKPYIAVIKDSKISAEQAGVATIDLSQYDVRIKGRREVPLAKDDARLLRLVDPVAWPRVLKYFRLIRRWTFKLPGLKFDLSMVRSTQDIKGKDGKSKGAWQRNFQDQNLTAQLPRYEIEVEIDKEMAVDKDKAYKTLLTGIGEILRGIQGNSVLISKQKKLDVLKEYRELTKTAFFRGVKPVTLEYKNMTADKDETEGAPNIRDDYNVTDKADGLRVLGFTDSTGELFMIDMSMNVYRTGLSGGEGAANSLLDGEYITQDKKGAAMNALLFFDMYYDSGVNVTQKPFKTEGECRYKDMDTWIKEFNKEGGPKLLIKSATLKVATKKFFFASAERSIFEQADAVLKVDNIRVYHTDGLIFTPNALPLPVRPGGKFAEQFKWKPAQENTVDFLITTVKDENKPNEDKVTAEIQPDTEKEIEYKTLKLFVGSSEDPAYRNPRDTILYKKPIPESYIGDREPRANKYRAVPFIPREYPDPYAAICKLETLTDPGTMEVYVQTEGTKQPIRDFSIVEMRYDPTKAPGWRWIPLRIREDKTERLFKGVTELKGDSEKKLLKFSASGTLGGTLNNEEAAENVWNSIHNPVTLYMITTGSETPSDKERAEFNISQRVISKRYYERKADRNDMRIIKSMQEFHNKHIKDTILYPAIANNTPNPIILDMAVGRANDLHRWRRIDAKFVLGVDATGACCIDHQDGGYRRLLDTKVALHTMPQAKRMPIPPMIFAIGDSSLRYVDGSASENDQESDILRALLGRVAPIGAVPPLVQDYMGQLKGGVDAMTCMYAIHYFFQAPEKLNGFLQNIADNLKIGGYFVGTNFDGEALFNMLNTTQKDKTKTGMDGDKILWEITKRYETSELPLDDSAFGMAVDVRLVSIGLTHTEYLVPWELLKEKMATIGCELLGKEELKKIGLENSSAMYRKSYEMATKTKLGKDRYKMPSIVEDFSFLNRWYIFKRTSSGKGEIGKILARFEGEVEEESLNSPEEAAAAPGAAAPGTVAPSAIARQGLFELSQSTQNSASPSEGEESVATALSNSAALNAAEQLYGELREAEARGDEAKLQALDRQSIALRSAMRGVGVPQASSAAFGGPAGSSVRAFVEEHGFGARLTVPVDSPTATRAKKYPADKLVQFNETSTKIIPNLELPEEYASYAARHLAPNAPFRVYDPRDPTDAPRKQYPSITHFMAAMKLKYASNRPELADQFAIDGVIHKKWNTKRQIEVKGKKTAKLTKKQQNELLEGETKDVEIAIIEAMADPAVGYDETRWMSNKNPLLSSAIAQRLESDKWFCVIINAVIAKRKYLLYVSEDMDMGGKYESYRGLIEGLNMYGNGILRIASEMPEKIRACLALPDA